LGFHYWWSRRESNPRPQVLYDQFYMLSRLFLVSLQGLAKRQAGLQPVTLDLALRPSDPA
jgi:hypothetical protein